MRRINNGKWELSDAKLIARSVFTGWFGQIFNLFPLGPRGTYKLLFLMQRNGDGPTILAECIVFHRATSWWMVSLMIYVCLLHLHNFSIVSAIPELFFTTPQTTQKSKGKIARILILYFRLKTSKQCVPFYISLSLFDKQKISFEYRILNTREKKDIF